MEVLGGRHDKKEKMGFSPTPLQACYEIKVYSSLKGCCVSQWSQVPLRLGQEARERPPVLDENRPDLTVDENSQWKRNWHRPMGSPLLGWHP